MIRINPRWTSRSCRCGFCDTCFITRCCIQLCRTKRSREIAGGFTRKNSIVASANFPVIGEPAAGKKRICRDFPCAEKIGLSGASLAGVATGKSSAFPLSGAGRAFQTARASSLRSF